MALAASRRLARSPALRALMAAWAAFCIGSYAYSVLVVMFVFSAAGVAAVGAAAVFTVLPGGLLAPITARLVTTPRPKLHLAVGIASRAVMVVATIAAVRSEASVAIVLALVAADAIVSAGVRPVHSALVVRLANTTVEAAAANAVTGLLVSAGALVGPALAGLGYWLLGIGWGFALPATVFVAGTIAALLIGVPDSASKPPTSAPAARAQLSAIRTGFRAIAASRPAAAATTIFVVNMALLGIWYVASAPVADEQLGLGHGGIALIMTFDGAGGFLAALATLKIVGRRRLAPVLLEGMLDLAILLAVIGLVAAAAPGLAIAACVGAAGALAYAVAPTLVQRSVAKEAMVPATACLQTLYLIGVVIGATAAPVLITWVGVTDALLVAGGAALAITLAAWPHLRRADDLSAEDIAKLRAIRATPLLAPLPALALEQLARTATRLTVPAGAVVVRQGEPGVRFYMIAAGLADVTVDGQRVATLGHGGSFGEIALLHDVPRSATVTAREELELVAVDRPELLGALSSDAGAVGRIGGLADVRLTTPPVRQRLVELGRKDAPDHGSIAEVLAVQPPLADIGSEARRRLAGSTRVMVAVDGALIVREGDYGEAYYVIVEGSVQVFEDETPVRRLGVGEGFGELAILNDVPQTATVRAVGTTVLGVIDREAFQRARQK